MLDGARRRNTSINSTDDFRMSAIFRVQVALDVALKTLTERHGKLA